MSQVQITAAVLRAPGTPLTVEELTLAPPRRGEVQVAIEAAGVCHSDLHYVRGELSSRLPVVPGHEGVAVVEAVGEGVTRVAPGDRVLLTWRPRCGECEACLRGRPALCAWGGVQARTGGLPDGSSRLSRDGETVHHLMGISCFADRCVVSERALVPVPADIPREVAAILGCAVTSGAGAVLNRMPGVTGQSVLVIGAGGVGLSAVMALKLIGAARIVVADRVSSHLRLASELGATDVVDVSATSAEEVLDQLGVTGLPWCLDTVGAPATLELAVAALAPAGTLVVTGLGRVGQRADYPVNRLVQQELSIVGSLYGSGNPALLVPELVEHYRSGRLPLDRLIGERFALGDINQAFAALASGATGRSILLPGR